MRIARLKSLAEHALAYDTETHRIQKGLLSPPLVCGSIGWLEPGPSFKGLLLNKFEAVDVFVEALESPDQVITGANLSYDALVVAVECSKLGVDIMPLIFAALCGDGDAALSNGRMYDLQIAEPLHAIACGHLGLDPRTGGELKNPETGRRGRYSLSAVVDLVLGRQDAKANDEWRQRYAELDDLPIEQWPAAARDYPVDDARNTLECSLAQVGHIPKDNHHHNWVSVNDVTQCANCHSTRISSQCMSRKPHYNLQEVSNQVWSAFGLHLGAAGGFRVDQSCVDVIARYYTKKRADHIAPFIASGVFTADGSEVQAELKKRVVRAYTPEGASQCEHCSGTGKMPSAATKPVRCPDCKGWCLADAKDGPMCRAWRAANPTGCMRCSNTALVPNPKPNMVTCKAIDRATCDGTGYVLGPDVPRADAGGVAKGRDILHESGDEFLMSLGTFKENDKILRVYVPYLRGARLCSACGHTGVLETKVPDPHAEGCPMPGWIDIPLTLRPNPILDTGRVSYEGAVMLFPRRPGFVDLDTEEYIPSLRECIVARGAQFELVEVADDHVLGIGEFVT